MAAALPCIVTTSVLGPKSRELAARLSAAECAEITWLSGDFPVFWREAAGCLVTDVDGNIFLDATSSFGVLGIGHCHRAVTRAISRQAGKLVHGMGDVHPSALKVELLEAIQRRSPIPDSRIILGQNGSDSVEAALKTAFLATGRPGVLAFEGGYHGLSYGALEPTARPFFREPFTRQRGKFASHLPFGADIASVRDALSADPNIGALIVEPIQGRGGIRIPPPGWLAGLRAACTEAGVLFIADEIFTGWGRTGAWFACSHEGVMPDLLCVGKAMGGGMPISACIGSAQVMTAAWGAGSSGESRHTYTFLGHPLSCAAAIAAIGVLESDGLVERSARMGEALLAGLNGLAGRYPQLVRQARGRGLMTGIELTSPDLAMPLVLDCLRSGLIVLPAGDTGNVIEIVPPYIISEELLEWCLSTLDQVLSRIASNLHD